MKTSVFAYLSLGSNLGMREEAIFTAVSRLDSTEGLSVLSLSSLYETAPQEIGTESPFINAVCKVSCSLAPLGLLDICQKIEHELGRTRSQGLGDRTIDIDIILYGSLSMSDDRLTIPHEKLKGRAFVLVPLIEIESDIVLPPDGVMAKDALQMVDLRKFWVRKVSGRMLSCS